MSVLLSSYGWDVDNILSLSSKTHLLTLYFLDSGAYAKSWFEITGITHSLDYDWIHQDQIDWFLEESGMYRVLLGSVLYTNFH